MKGYRVSSFGFRVSGFEFRVSGIEFEGCDLVIGEVEGEGRASGPNRLLENHHVRIAPAARRHVLITTVIEVITSSLL